MKTVLRIVETVVLAAVVTAAAGLWILRDGRRDSERPAVRKDDAEPTAARPIGGSSREQRSSVPTVESSPESVEVLLPAEREMLGRLRDPFGENAVELAGEPSHEDDFGERLWLVDGWERERGFRSDSGTPATAVFRRPYRGLVLEVTLSRTDPAAPFTVRLAGAGGRRVLEIALTSSEILVAEHRAGETRIVAEGTVATSTDATERWWLVVRRGRLELRRDEEPLLVPTRLEWPVHEPFVLSLHAPDGGCVVSAYRIDGE